MSSPGWKVRFFAISASLSRALGPLALAIAAPLADTYGTRPFWYAATAGTLVIALIRRFTPAIYEIEDLPKVEHTGG